MGFILSAYNLKDAIQLLMLLNRLLFACMVYFNFPHIWSQQSKPNVIINVNLIFHLKRPYIFMGNNNLILCFTETHVK
jgi:hypothetical protein